MRQTDIHNFCKEVNFFIHTIYKYKNDAVSVVNKHHMMDKGRKNFELYLRWFPTESWAGKNTLVISRFRFTPSRKGRGTDFLKFITEQSVKYCIDRVVIEMANENSSAFAEIFGFERDYKGYEKCWSITTDQLSRFFEMP